MIWKPHVSVAVVVEHQGRFLMVEERAGGRIVLNQPAGHWEAGETLPEAAVREAVEETGAQVEPYALVGIYRWHHSTKDITYLRFAFAARLLAIDCHRTLDAGIERAVWLSAPDILADPSRHRSPLVAACLEDYLRGARHPLHLLHHL